MKLSILRLFFYFRLFFFCIFQIHKDPGAGWQGRMGSLDGDVLLRLESDASIAHRLHACAAQAQSAIQADHQTQSPLRLCFYARWRQNAGYRIRCWLPGELPVFCGQKPGTFLTDSLAADSNVGGPSPCARRCWDLCCKLSERTLRRGASDGKSPPPLMLLNPGTTAVPSYAEPGHTHRSFLHVLCWAACLPEYLLRRMPQRDRCRLRWPTFRKTRGLCWRTCAVCRSALHLQRSKQLQNEKPP